LRRARPFAGGAAALALLAAGCLEAKPPPAKGYLPGDGAVVVPELDGGAPSDDGASLEAGPRGDGGPGDWAGTWQFTSGSQGTHCGGTLAVIAVDGFLDITPSASGNLLTVVEDGCSFTFDLAGDVATEEPNQACAAWAIPTIPTWTLTMQPDGTLHEMIGGDFVMGGEVCSLSGSATLVHR
jgi:hypothetical protein